MFVMPGIVSYPCHSNKNVKKTRVCPQTGHSSESKVQDWIDLVMSMWRGVVVSLGGDVSGTFFLLLWKLDQL